MILTVISMAGVLAALFAPRLLAARRTVVLYTALAPEEQVGLEAVAQGFSRDFPAYTVVYHSMPAGSATPQGRPRADMYLLGHYALWRELAAGGLLAHVPDTIGTGAAGAAITAAYTSGGLTGGTGDGSRRYAVPVLWAPYGVYANRMVLTEKEAAAPESWSALMGALPRIHDHRHPVPLAVAGAVPRRMELAREVFAFNGGADGAAIFDTLLRDGLIHPSSERLDDEDTSAMLLDGRLAMVLAPATIRRSIAPEQLHRVRFYPLLTHDGRPPAVAARVVAAGAARRGLRKPAASAFLEYLTRASTQETWVSAAGSRVTFNAVHPSARVPDAEGATVAALGRIAGVILPE